MDPSLSLLNMKCWTTTLGLVTAAGINTVFQQ